MIYPTCLLLNHAMRLSVKHRHAHSAIRTVLTHYCTHKAQELLWCKRPCQTRAHLPGAVGDRLGGPIAICELQLQPREHL